MRDDVWYEYGYEAPLADFIKRLQAVMDGIPPADRERAMFEQSQGDIYGDGEWSPGSMRVYLK